MPSVCHCGGSVDKDLLLISRISRIHGGEKEALNKLDISSLNPLNASDLFACVYVCQIQPLI